MANHEVDNLIIQHGDDRFIYAPDLSAKVDKDQGTANAGKALGIGNDGMVTPMPFTGNDFTGATASDPGVHGYVPAPAAGDQMKVLMGDGTWGESPSARVVTVEGTVSNVSGSYAQNFSSEEVVANMKAVELELSNPEVFNGKITVTPGNGQVLVSCPSVAGQSTIKISLIKTVTDPTAVTSSEFDILSNRIEAILNCFGLTYYNGGIYVDPDQE